MVYNYHNRPRVSNVLWYADVDMEAAKMHQRTMSACTKDNCPDCYKDYYDTVVNGDMYYKSTIKCDGDPTPWYIKRRSEWEDYKDARLK